MAQKTNQSINLVDLDQQSLVNDFRNFLRNQDEFKDYDFKGSSINVLLDLMAYNTFKNAFYLNMAFSERWIDSAQLRSSIFSHVKELNYLPRSVRSARAKIKVNFTATGDSQPYIVQKGSQFSTIIKSKSYTFTIPETIILSSVDTNFQFETDIYEGIFVKDSYVMISDTQKFKITNKNVDLRSVAITVFEDNAEIGLSFKQATTLLDLNETSKVFFIQTSETGHYEILFGDNILGRRPKQNSLIVLDYRISEGKAGNGAKTFSVDFDPTNTNELISSPELEVIEASTNGEDEESNDSIKYYAPRYYQTQERTVNASDYNVLLSQNFPEINAVSVFGGEDLNPPQFGKVFIAVDVKDVDGLPDSKKDEYYNFIKKRAPFSIEPEFIEPEILYLSIKTLVRYNINITSNSLNRTKALVTDAIVTFNDLYLNNFNVKFRNSLLSKTIDAADSSIVSNISDVFAYKKIVPTLNKPNNFIVDFGFSIKNNLAPQQTVYNATDESAVFSSIFTYENQICTIEDDGNGIIRIVKTDENNKIAVLNIGTVDYTSGTIKIVGLKPSAFDGNAIKIYIDPDDKDIISEKNNILLIDPSDINVSVQAVRE